MDFQGEDLVIAGKWILGVGSLIDAIGQTHKVYRGATRVKI
ncbi:hypothetical protein AB7942_29710 [Neobacillus sp. BF23-41]